MNNKTAAALLASGLVLATASSLWLREVRRVSRHDAIARQLRLLPTAPARPPAPKAPRWTDPAIDRQQELERKAKDMLLYRSGTPTIAK